jgi:PAS domain S-box-containing protein
VIATLQTSLIPVSILVVDDREENRVSLRAILSSPMYRIVEASSGTEALRRILDEDFALLLIDVVMPEMNGIELVRAIKERPRSAATPVVFLTGQALDEEFVYAAYRAGAVDYLVKPLQPEIVRAKVAVFAELFRQRQRIAEQAAQLVEAQRRDRELRQLELRLAGERHFRNLADAVPHIVWTAAADGTVDYFNRRWFEFTGLSIEQSARTWFGAVHPDDVETCRLAWENARLKAEECRLELRLRAADGRYHWHVARAIPEKGARGAVVSWVGSFTDIEQQKDVLRGRDEFLSVASHELRTPLSSLQLLVALLLKKPLSPDEAKAKLENASRQIDRLVRLIAELMDVSRITAGSLSLEPAEVDLSAVARDVVSRLSEDAVKACCEIDAKLAVPVPLKLDRTRMDQVITNLLTNAMKFGAGKPIEVSVEPTAAGGRLIVRDHGIGVPPEDTNRIFERYVRGASAKAFGGIGLGLYIVRQIVLAHGGTIRVESEPGAGSTFIVELPHAPPVAEDEGPTAVPRARSATRTP